MVTMRVLFVFLVLEHRRRQVLHFNVTEHPTADWTSQQIVEAFADRDAPRYLMRDRDRIYGSEVRLRIASLGIEEILTAPRIPWQNAYVERVIGFDTKRLFEPFRNPERQASEARPGLVCRLLPWGPNPFGARQAMSIPSTGFEHRQDPRNPAAGRSPSPL